MKRFTETQKWGKPWFRKLSPKHKLLWQWLCDNCDSAGVVDPDWDVSSLQIGEAVNGEDLAVFGDRVAQIDGGKLWLSTFIEFQYGRLSRECKPHAQIFASMEKHGIDPNSVSENQRVSKGYPKGIHTLQEQDKEKDKEKEGGAGGIPPVTLAAAKAGCGQWSATPEMAEKWWLDQDARGWLDGRGQPIRRWQSSLQSYAISWRGFDNKNSGGKTSDAAHAPDTKTKHGF